MLPSGTRSVLLAGEGAPPRQESRIPEAQERAYVHPQLCDLPAPRAGSTVVTPHFSVCPIRPYHRPPQCSSRCFSATLRNDQARPPAVAPAPTGRAEDRKSVV